MRQFLYLEDAICQPQPDAVKLQGLLGHRLDLSRLNRLRNQEEDHLLWPFHEHCPIGMNHPDRPRPEIYGDWQGEYIGTWLDSAVLSAWNAADEQLSAKIDAMVSDWLSTQQEDGYLGTYDEPDRWKSWDVWVQAHNLIGLYSYYRYTGHESVLVAAIKVAERVMRDFGPGKRFLYPTGPHGGMASSSFLEPLLWLYEKIGKTEYLEWAMWLVDDDWEQPDGPKIISSLLAGRGVAGTANAKGIEMLICFSGMVELYKATGNERYLEPILIAWDDIIQHHLYITGSASTGEYFMTDYTLRNDGVYMIGETCVSMGWMYLNLKLGRLLGEARFFNMAEQVLYNHLLAAQSPDGRGWAYYVGLRDSKRYRWHIDPECCPTRGVRALAQIPTHVFGVNSSGIVVNFFEASQGKLTLPTGNDVVIKLKSNYPFDGEVNITLIPDQTASFALCLRLPGWCKKWDLRLNGESKIVHPNVQGYIELVRAWYPGDEVHLRMEMPVHIVADQIGNYSAVALVRGPLVFAADHAYLPERMLLEDVILQLSEYNLDGEVQITQDEKTGSTHLLIPIVAEKLNASEGWWREPERYRVLIEEKNSETRKIITMVPFFEAGNLNDPDNYKDGFWTRFDRVNKITFQVWLPFKIT
jgi:uncharacterized protein